MNAACEVTALIWKGRRADSLFGLGFYKAVKAVLQSYYTWVLLACGLCYVLCKYNNPLEEKR